MTGGMMMKISKRSLRLLPVTLLLEMLTPFLTFLIIIVAGVIAGAAGKLAGTVTAAFSGLLLVAVWITGSVFVYGIMELSRYFRYSWYLHIVCFVLKAVNLVLDGFSSIMGDEVAPGTVNTYQVITDVLSSARQLTGITAIGLAIIGLMVVLHKVGEQTLSRKCRKYAYFVFILGILLTLADIVNLILTVAAPGISASPSTAYLPFLVIYAMMVILMVIISIPVFMTIRKSCKTIYGMLSKAQEV